MLVELAASSTIQLKASPRRGTQQSLESRTNMRRRDSGDREKGEAGREETIERSAGRKQDPAVVDEVIRSKEEMEGLRKGQINK